MKKKQLETLEKINEERKLDKETKAVIYKKILKNFLFAIGILVLFITLRFMALNLDKTINILVYKILSVISLAATIILFEVAYKKDDDTLAITSIEMLFLSITLLLAPYILIIRKNVFTSMIGVYFTIYYIIKNLIIYRNKKNKYLQEKSDITQIIKKESKDEMAQEQLEKTKQEQKPKRKRGRPRKVKNNE